MLFLPKNDGEFDKAIRRLKEEYLGQKNTGANDEQAFDILSEKYSRTSSKLEKLLKTKQGRRKIKREFCRMENKRIERELEGRANEAQEIEEKFALWKCLYSDKSDKKE
ncbi:hypothetical protein SAMN02745116_00723 [Pilibacter termitis]|uniref:Uncharacterized protein n=1 Tax=Pilibacter termitis TaxID=263852 RepID=A0A1T4LM31_9ENTE|nr:hypothetical protein [Pilibacter termitis]SJZ55775.1 hypothetical protein SAMN02745116_00723 [Pilibacter termitis]